MFLSNMLVLNLWKIKKTKTFFVGMVNESKHKPNKLQFDQEI